MLNRDFSCSQSNDMIPAKEVGTFLEDLFNSDPVSSLTEMYEKTNIQVIRWLKENHAPAEMIASAVDAEAQSSNVMLEILDEIQRSGQQYCIVPKDFLRFLAENVGPRAAAMYRSLKDSEYLENKQPSEEKDYRER